MYVKQFKRRKFLQNIAFGAVMMTLVNCATPPAPTAEQESAETTAAAPETTAVADEVQKTFVVGHDLWIGYAGVFVADAKGYFEDAGLDVQFKQFPGPGDTLPALIAGKLDIGLTTLHNFALASLKEDVPLKAIYLLDTSNGADAIIAKQDITSVADLKGKKVAATDGEVNHMMLLAALDQNGLTEDDIDFVNMNADDAGAAFLAGQIDAAVTWEPWVTKAKGNGGNIVFTSADIPNTILDSVVVSPKTLETREADLTAFINAIDAGVKYLREEPDESAAIIAKVLDAQPEDVMGMLATDKIYDLAENKELYSGGQAADSLSRVTDFLLNKELIDSTDGSESLLVPSLVE